MSDRERQLERQRVADLLERVISVLVRLERCNEPGESLVLDGAHDQVEKLLDDACNVRVDAAEMKEEMSS